MDVFVFFARPPYLVPSQRASVQPPNNFALVHWLQLGTLYQARLGQVNRRIEGAQNDHITAVQAILAHKDLLVWPSASFVKKPSTANMNCWGLLVGEFSIELGISRECLGVVWVS